MPQKFVTIQNTSYKNLTQHTIWRLQCVDGDERWRTDVDGWNYDGHWMELQQTSDWIATNVRWNNERHQMIIERTTTMPMTMLQSDPHPWILQRWRAKEKKEFFFSTLCFLLLLFFFSVFFSFSSSSKATTWATHYMTTSSKTHRSAQPRC
jgi:hypothetical protein